MHPIRKKQLFTGKSVFLSLLMLFSISAITWSQEDEKKQPVPRFEKIAAGENGLHIYMPKGDSTTVLETSYSMDSSVVYTGEVPVGDFTFAVIAVQFGERQEMGQEQKEELLISYLDYLQQSFEIMEATGYGKGHTLEAVPSMIGVIDYWEDSEFNTWAVKGWGNDEFLVVYMIYGPGDYPYIGAKQMFFEGVRVE